jgi:hypothetical protein
MLQLVLMDADDGTTACIDDANDCSGGKQQSTAANDGSKATPVQ